MSNAEEAGMVVDADRVYADCGSALVRALVVLAEMWKVHDCGSNLAYVHVSPTSFKSTQLVSMNWIARVFTDIDRTSWRLGTSRCFTSSRTFQD